jgi:hypothetical protein
VGVIDVYHIHVWKCHNQTHYLYNEYMLIKKKENVAYIHNGILFYHKKGWSPDTCNNRDDSTGNYMK